MGKLGKKARKFAKKHLQSVLRRRRKTKALFKRKSSSKDRQDRGIDQVRDVEELSKGRIKVDENVEDIFLDAIASDESGVTCEESDSDGYISEGLICQEVLEEVGEIELKGNSGINMLSDRNRKIHKEVSAHNKKLAKLKKDLEFRLFLKSNIKGHEALEDEEQYSDDERRTNHGLHVMDEDKCGATARKILTSSVISSWCQLVMEEKSEPAVVSLLNAYRAACHYGTESIGSIIESSETFCNILMFMLREANNIFFELLKVSSSNCKKETILELKSTTKWKRMEPLIKSYLRSTIFLLSQVTDSEILAFSLARLRASLTFFAAFPFLLHRLIKITAHLWTTGADALSSSSFLLIRDVAVIFGAEYFDICLSKAFKAFIAQCRVLEVDVKRIEFLKNCLVDLCSLDVQKSSGKALASVQQLAKILLLGLREKKLEAVKRICAWEYVNFIDVWVSFVSANIRDFDLQPLLYMIAQLINGIACMFPAPRYFPLRLKCIQWINNLSRSSGVFIPVSSMVLDVLEYKFGKDSGKPGKDLSFQSSLKLSKNFLRSQNFEKQCVSSVIELLSEHFSLWSFHISFPEIATIPLIHLKRFSDITAIESLRRMVKRLIDQVELNVDFVQRKRHEVSFSPKDHQSVESFLQVEKCCSNAPFMQYYSSVIEKATGTIPRKKKK